MVVAEYDSDASTHSPDIVNEPSDYRQVTKRLRSEMNYRALGQHMRSVRRQHHMTQAQVAETMQMTEKYYASIESGTIQISLPRLVQFITIMQVSADFLLAGCHKKYPAHPTEAEYHCADRQKLERILDGCSDEQIGIICVVAESLVSRDASR